MASRTRTRSGRRIIILPKPKFYLSLALPAFILLLTTSSPIVSEVKQPDTTSSNRQVREEPLPPPDPRIAIERMLLEVTEGTLRDTKPVADQIYKSATKYNLDPMLIVALGQAESSWRLENVKSPKGAIGPLQVMPSTFKAYGGINIHDWRENIDIGCKYLNAMIRRANGNIDLALAYYHAGPSRPDKTVMSLSKDYIRKINGHIKYTQRE